MGSGESRGRGWVTMARFLLLCLLWALDSVRGDLLPGWAASPMPALERQALQYGLLAVAAGAFALVRRVGWPRPRRALGWMLAGAGLFFLPALLVYVSRQWISDLTRVALFSLVPVFAVVLDPYLGRAEAMLSGNRLVAALAAVAGTLCVFPVDLPGSISAAGGWGVVILAAFCIAAANCHAVELAEEEMGKFLAPAVAIASGSAAVGFALASALMERSVWSVRGSEVTWTAAVIWPGLLLLFWLMRRMTAVSMTTRFLVAPLLANLFGLVVLRPTVSIRAGLGLVLIAGGAGWLLLGRPEEQEKINSTQPLGLD